jgi:thioesterase domain-containing protein/acyl carrier protein
LDDGKIEYLGRIDNQVKIRGFRIELGEIETLLGQHPAIAQTTVIVREDRPGDRRLVAYCVADPHSPPKINQLRDFISQQVPNYMVPAMFVLLPTLPMTANGKVDRRALPAPDDLRPELEDTSIAPRNELETQLTQIWGKVLGLQSIGIRDNFFELGGNSLLAVRLLSKIQTNLGHKLPLSMLFTAQTIEQLAEILTPTDSVDPAMSWSSLVPIQTTGSKPPLFFIHAVWGNVLFYKELVSYLEPDRPCYGLQAQGLDGQQAPSTSVVEMAAHYIQAIQSVQPQGPYAICGNSFGGVVAFEVAKQLHEDGEKIAFLAAFDTAAPTATAVTDGSELLDLGSQLLVHLRIFVKLKLSDQFTYVWERLKWHLIGGKVSLFYRFYLRYLNRSPSALRLLDVGLANRQARQCYRPTAYPGSITLFRAKQEYPEEFQPAADLGWSELATGKVEVYEVPGKHDTMMHEPQVQVLAEQVKVCLQRVEIAIAREGKYEND